MNLFIPIILIAISVGAFFTFIDPQYKEVQELDKISKEFQEKESQGEEIRRKKRELTDAYDQNISPEDVIRLEKMMPNHMDNVELIVDIERIAVLDGIRIGDISLVQNAKNNRDASASIEIVENKNYESVNLAFSFVTKYENFKSFMEKLRKSLRLLDVVSINFSKQEDQDGSSSDNFRFDVTVRAYWLKK